jgi:flagellar basal body rod protein FlgG
MELNQEAHQGNITTGQGYQVQNNAGSKVYISAMIQPVPKSKKEQKYIKASKSSNIVTTSYHRVPAMVRPTKRSVLAERTTQGKYLGQDTRQWC